MEVTGKILFREEQKFGQGWLYLIMLSSALISIGILLAMGIGNRIPFTELFLALGIIILVNFLTIYFFRISRLETIVTEQGIFYRWRPFYRKYSFINRHEVDNAEERKAPALQYGAKWYPGYGKVHNTSDGKGVQLYLKNGKKIFFGSQETFLLRRAVEKIITKEKINPVS